MIETVSQITGKLQAQLPTQVLGDPAFRGLLAVGAEAIRKDAKKAMNEATIEAAFERHLFVILREVGVDYAPIKEGSVKGTLLRTRGRTDSRFKNVVIEFKHRSEMTTATAVETHKEQLFDYLQALSAEESGEQIGFLTDGLNFVRCTWSVEGEGHASGLEPISADGLSLFCRAIVASKSTALNSANLVSDFCGADYDGYLLQAARHLFDCIIKSASIKTEMLRSEWESLFRLSHEDTSQQSKIQLRRKALQDIFDIKIESNPIEYLCLFSLHTAYSIVIKLMSYKVASDTVFGTSLMNFKDLIEHDDDILRAFMASLEEGETFRQVGIINMLEGDFFSWYSDAHQWDEQIAGSVREILRVLSRYEDAKSIFAAKRAIDLFRHLYEGAIPQVVRSSFGEFYTPLWLAQHVLSTSGFVPGERVLDPCCGSGTFLIATLQALREQRGDLGDADLLAQMLNSVVGVDLNPLAVLTARVHYFIYINDLVELGDELLIPVFLGDSSNLPKLVGARTSSPYYSFEIKTLKTPITVEVPLSVAEDSSAMFKLMNAFEASVARADYNSAVVVMKNFCQLRKLAKPDADRLTAIAHQIIDLEKNHWNGIWARIIANFSATVAIGKFHRIIGNPPWIDWKSLPTGYRDTIKALCVEKKLFSGAGRTGGINLNVCALIAHVAAVNWLEQSGTLAFLMPRELAVQPSYEGWRGSVGGVGCRLTEMHDWTEAGHPFEPVREDFMTFVLKRTKATAADVKCWAYTKLEKRAKPWLWLDLQEAEAKLRKTRHYARSLVPGKTALTFAETRAELDEFALITGACDYIGREGIEFYPQELMMFRYLRKGPTKNTVFVENFQGVKSKYKIPRQEILLETKFLFPLVKGPFITPYEYEQNEHLVAFPYRESDPHRPIDRTTLHRESPLLLAHFIKFQKQLSSQTAYSDSLRAEGEFYGVARTGPYSFAHTYVAFRDNTRWSACVVTDKLMPWGGSKRYLFQNHAVSMCERSDRQFINEDEAHYIVAILNSEIVYKFIHSSSDERSFKIRPPIFIPRYSSQIADHVALSQLSKEAHANEDLRAVAARRASALYHRVCAAK